MLKETAAPVASVAVSKSAGAAVIAVGYEDGKIRVYTFDGQAEGELADHGGDGSRHSRCRFRVLQKPILGTADSECWHCLGVRTFLLEIPQASMNEAR